MSNIPSLIFEKIIDDIYYIEELKVYIGEYLKQKLEDKDTANVAYMILNSNIHKTVIKLPRIDTSKTIILKKDRDIKKTVDQILTIEEALKFSKEYLDVEFISQIPLYNIDKGSIEIVYPSFKNGECFEYIIMGIYPDYLVNKIDVTNG